MFGLPHRLGEVSSSSMTLWRLLARGGVANASISPPPSSTEGLEGVSRDGRVDCPSDRSAAALVPGTECGEMGNGELDSWPLARPPGGSRLRRRV